MSRWAKKAAIERMQANQELQQVYTHYPLTKLLVESAVKTRRYPGYHRISHYYAYKDWLWAAIGHENEASGICLRVIDDLLPPDDSDLDKEGGSSIVTDNPSLPGLPPLPKRVQYERRLYSLSEIMNDPHEKEEQRHLVMRGILEDLTHNAQ